LEIQSLVASLFLPAAAIILTLKGAAALNSRGDVWLFNVGLLCCSASAFNLALSLCRHMKPGNRTPRLGTVVTLALLVGTAIPLGLGTHLRHELQERHDAHQLASIPLEILNLYGPIPDGDLKPLIGKGNWVDTTTPFFEHVSITSVNSRVSISAEGITTSTCARALLLLDELPEVYQVVSDCNGTRPSIRYTFSGELPGSDAGSSNRRGTYPI
jgi:hypothetical protein